MTKYIYAEMIFFDRGQHCRKTPPNLFSYKYRPHLIVKGQPEYFGVQFLDGEEVVLGKVTKGTAECLYDGIDYNALETGVSFFIVEGTNKVGEGKILKTWTV